MQGVLFSPRRRTRKGSEMSHEWVFLNWTDNNDENLKVLSRLCRDLRLSLVRFYIPNKGHALVISDVFAPSEVMRMCLPEDIQWVAEDDGRFGWFPEKKTCKNEK